MIDWKFAAREKLRDYPLQQNALRSIPLEIETLKSQAESIKAVDPENIRVAGGEGSREDMLLSNLQKRGDLERMLSRARLQVDQIESALRVIGEEDSHLLDLRYIHPCRGNIDRLRVELGLQDERSVHRRVDKALKRFTEAMYSCTES